MVDKSEKFRWLVRLGYAARGVTYMLLGYIAMSTQGDAEGGGSAAFDFLQDIPFGTLILWLVTLGLMAYCVFKFISAIADVQHRGSDTKGILKRVGDFASGIAHIFLAYAAFQFATGSKQQATDDGGSQEIAASLLTWGIGPLLIGILGIGFIVGAIMQAKTAATGSVMHHVSSQAPAGVKTIGRIGTAARAIVFLVIGWSMMKSAWFSDGDEIKGLGDAILSLRDNGTLYTLVAIGLMLFGVFSLIVSRYRIIPDVQKEDLKPKLH